MPHDGHDHAHHHGPSAGHNLGGAEHLHSHLHGASDKDVAADLKDLTMSFLDGFRAAKDKTSFLRISGVPFSRDGEDGLTLHLVDARIETKWQIGTASPGFGTKELVYMPFPGAMIDERETMTFTYVSLTTRADVDLLEILKDRAEQGA